MIPFDAPRARMADGAKNAGVPFAIQDQVFVAEMGDVLRNWVCDIGEGMFANLVLRRMHGSL